MIQPHLNIDKIRKYVLLPGDPGRLDTFAKFLKGVKEVSFNREYKVIEGNYQGVDVSVVSSGMGCPSAAIAVEELANIGAEVIIRVGTCGGLLTEMSAGDLVIPSDVLCWDGTTKEYKKGIDRVKPNKQMFNLLLKSAEKKKIKFFTGINRTHDAYYEPTENFLKLKGQGIVSSEMEASAVLLVSQLRGLKAGCILVVKTPEPPELVEKDPEMIYKLINEEKVIKGTDDAIYIALETIKSFGRGKEL